MKQSKHEYPSYRETRWHLLRIEKNGAMRPFVHFRGLVMLAAGLIFVMAGAIGWLVTAWLDAREALVTSQETVARQDREYQSIRHEIDGALARLAIAESKLKAVTGGPPAEKQPEPPSLKKGEKTPVEPVAAEAPATKRAPDAVGASQKAPGPADEDPETTIEKVTADNLFICADPVDTTLNIEFKVINMGTRKQPISGHAFVVLKDDHAEEDRWLVVPKAMLMDGRPVQSRGQRFRIYNYRTIKFKVTHENPGEFVQATIFIFKESGELIFERDFSLEPIQVCP